MDGSPNLPVLGAPATDFVQTGTTPLGLIWILTPDSATPLPSGELTLRGYQQVALEDPVVTWAVLDDQNQVVREGSVEARGNEVGWRSWEVKLTLTAGEYVFRVSSAEATAQERHFTVQ